jgi:hypothetical protein
VIAFILKYEMFYNGEMAFGLYQVTKMICNELQLVILSGPLSLLLKPYNNPVMGLQASVLGLNTGESSVI